MESALVRNLKTGQLISNAPLQFVRLPNVGDYIQLGNAAWVVSTVIHAWRNQNDPLCEIRIFPPTRDENLPIEHSAPEQAPS